MVGKIFGFTVSSQEQFLILFSIFIQMENVLASSKKINSFFKSHHTYGLSPFSQSHQDSAKDVLIGLAEMDHPILIKNRTMNIDHWNVGKINVSMGESNKPLNYMRRTLHLRGTAETFHRSNHNQENIEESMISRLKHVLRKLQSPEKQREFQEKKINTENWTQNAGKSRGQATVDQTAESRQYYIRTKNQLKEKKNSKMKVSSMNNKLGAAVGQSPKRHTRTKQKLLDPKQFSEQMGLFRQARRRRTLKNLLF